MCACERVTQRGEGYTEAMAENWNGIGCAGSL